MKAYVLEGINNLVYKDVGKPQIKEDWVLVKVGAAGICSSDISRIYTDGTYHFPTIPGHEFAGRVVEVGKKVNTKWIGKKVAVFPLIPCKKCVQCLNKNYEMCEKYDYIGSRRDGAYAEYVAVPEWNLIGLDDNADMKEYALMEPLAVALHAIKKVKNIKNCSVNVIGTGMIAIASAMWAVKYGADNVSIIGRNNKKMMMINGIERINYKNYKEDEFIETADVVIEAVGSQESISNAIKFTKTAGELILMGNPHGNIVLDKNIYWRILRKQLNLVGTWNSSYESKEKCDWTEVKEAIEERDINVRKLITHILPKEELKKGLEIMKNHTESYSRIITVWTDEEIK